MDRNDKDRKIGDSTSNTPGASSRRTFLKAAGMGAAGAALVVGAGKWGLFPGPNNDAATPSMKPENLSFCVNPKNGDRISLLGFGCMRFPVLPEAKAPSSPQIDEAAAFQLVDRAIECGINYFDTGFRYHGGASEVVLGKALKRHNREHLFIADKMPPTENFSLAETKEVFQTQLKRLQTDYIDYYLLHSLSTVEIFKRRFEDNGALEYLLEEKAAGRIHNLGWSFHGDADCLNYVLDFPMDWDFALIQLNYHDLLYKYEVPDILASRLSNPVAEPKWVYEQMLKTDIPLFVMEPLLGGRLARLNTKALRVLQQERPTDSAAAWALRYVGALPQVIGVLSGMTYREHLEDNVKTFSPLRPLSEQELLILREALNIFVSQDIIRCTACSYCLPCPYGIDIPGVFTHFNRCVDDEQIPKGERNADYERARRAYLVGYDRSVAELSQAERCTGCNECKPKCPQRIDIPTELARLGRFVEQLRNEA